MADLYEELLEIYCRYAEDESDESFDANGNARDQLGEAIVRIARPRTVGDVMALPHEYLRWDGLVHLIERDASDEYDDVEGYVECVLMEDVEERITPEQHGFDGSELCEWIDQIYPEGSPHADLLPAAIRESVRKDIASISECFAGVDPEDFMQTMKELRSDD